MLCKLGVAKKDGTGDWNAVLAACGGKAFKIEQISTLHHTRASDSMRNV